MKITLSERMRATIREVSRDARASSMILDIHKAALKVQNVLPNENIALEDIMAAFLHSCGDDFDAFEFDLRGAVIEVIMTVPDSDRIEIAPITMQRIAA